MSHNINPFSGTLPSQDRTLEDHVNMHTDKNNKEDKPVLKHPDYNQGEIVKNTGGALSTEFGTSVDINSPHNQQQSSPQSLAIPFQFGNAGINFMQRRSIDEGQYSTQPRNYTNHESHRRG